MKRTSHKTRENRQKMTQRSQQECVWNVKTYLSTAIGIGSKSVSRDFLQPLAWLLFLMDQSIG